MQHHLRKTGFIVLLLTGLLDQLSKQLVTSALYPSHMIPITSFFDFFLTYNNGVSFGLFPADSLLGKGMLLFFGIAFVIWLLVSLWNAPTKLETISYGFIIGGALGNILDRIYYGAVIDFLHFHYLHYSFPVFNIADSAITVGVCLILLQQAWHLGRNKKVI